MRDLTPFEKEAIRVGLQDLFKPQGHFSICDVEAMTRLAGVIPPQRTMDALHCLHCVSWAVMTPEMRQLTAQTVLGLFENPGFDLPSLHKSFLPEGEKPPQVEGGFFSRMLGKGSVQ